MIKWQLFPATSYAELAQQWQELNRRTAKTQLLDPLFVQPLLNHFADGELQIAVATDNGRWVAAGIFKKLGWGRWQTFQPSQAPIGCWLCEAQQFNNALLKSLTQALPGITLALGLTQLDPAMLPRPQETATLTTLDYITTGRLQVPADYDEYWRSRSKNVRQNSNKAKNRLVKEGTAVRFEAISNPEQIASCVRDYGLIESSGWKNHNGTAIHPDNDQGRFYTEMLTNFAPAQAEVWRYSYDEAVVATDLCIRDAQTLIILKTTFDEDWKKNSPAFCMHLDGINHCAELNVRSIEFFGPAMEWHNKLTDDLRTQYHLNWAASPLIYPLKNLLHHLKKPRIAKT